MVITEGTSRNEGICKKLLYNNQNKQKNPSKQLGSPRKQTLTIRELTMQHLSDKVIFLIISGLAIILDFNFMKSF